MKLPSILLLALHQRRKTEFWEWFWASNAVYNSCITEAMYDIEHGKIETANVNRTSSLLMRLRTHSDRRNRTQQAACSSEKSTSTCVNVHREDIIKIGDSHDMRHPVSWLREWKREYRINAQVYPRVAARTMMVRITARMTSRQQALLRAFFWYRLALRSSTFAPRVSSPTRSTFSLIMSSCPPCS